MLAKFLLESKKTVVFSGAGMSTESGLADFRSAGRGMWNDRDPMQLASVEALRHNQSEFEGFYRWRIEEMKKCAPNPGHHFLAAWQASGLINGIITQNVENYHELAGTKTIAKLHGDLGVIRCQSCGNSLPSDRYLRDENSTTCPKCRGYLRPGVVLFGESLPEAALDLAETLMKDVELFVVLGSSLVVSPANQFPRLAKKAGARLAIINLEPTPLDDIANLIIHEPIVASLTWTNQVLKHLPR